ncbi:Sugar kinase of the NBD/HSP70 family, may contain an N-terminal HTH domain [Nocardioides alpinus]|uniref:ROK family transcriptional regulator n=1 Tax=Nocardioides alpinus TaxID=748909 RepID=A0A1I0V6C5_9ACTN|nr:ROK family transcriptional regulator [Nocardioides alpinus]PKH37090.1 ROK family transcriptional regulator [Nocardioides alpinus]SFA71905.1 Sugar kinase of the NBD/HSP70 family, may contain an N-terminal HTH domain [Nocardioides alpinus]
MRSGLEGELLRVLRDGGPQTKNQLATALGVPRTTLTASLRCMAAAGHVEDGPVAASSGGRRSVTVRIAGGRRLLVVSLGEDTARVAVLDGHLTISAGVSIDLQDRDPDAEWLADTVRRAARRLLGPEAPSAVGIAVADRGTDLEVTLAERLAEACPGAPVAVLPSVRAMALGEMRSGGTTGVDDFVAVRLGGSVTTAAVVGGHLGLGANGRSGEIGHLRVEEFGPACGCGLTGCLDSFISASALVTQATSLVGRGRSPALAAVLDHAGALDLRDLVTAGRAGDPVVGQVGRDLGQRLGRVVAGMVAQSNPRRVVVGGPVAAMGSLFLGDLRATVYRVAPHALAEGLEITLSDPDGRADLIGSASAAMTAWIGQDFSTSGGELPMAMVRSPR